MSSPNPSQSTPRRVARFKSTTPGSTARLQCSADPAAFTLVKIHTAKCSVCDKRNTTDEMRRCQACTWQICKICQTAREEQGRLLVHGNLKAIAPSKTAVRRRVLLPIGSMIKSGEIAVESALPETKAEEVVGPSIAKKSAETNGVFQEATPSPQPPLSYQNMKPTKPNKLAQEAMQPPESSGHTKSNGSVQEAMQAPESYERTKLPRKLTRKENINQNLKKYEIKPHYKHYYNVAVSKGDEFAPFAGVGNKRGRSLESPPVTKDDPDPKRSRTQPPEVNKAMMAVPTDFVDMKPQQQVHKSKKTTDDDYLIDFGGIGPSSQQTTATVIKDQLGVDFPQPQGPSVDYTTATWHNVPVKIPKVIARGGKPRRTGEEWMAEEIRPRVRANLQNRQKALEAEDPAPAPATPTTSAGANGAPGDTGEPERVRTLRDTTEDEHRNLYHQFVLDPDQQIELATAMMEAARKYGVKMAKYMTDGPVPGVDSGLEVPVQRLTDHQQQKVIAEIQKAAGEKLQQFEAEGAPIKPGFFDKKNDGEGSA